MPLSASSLTWTNCNRTIDTIKGGSLEIHYVSNGNGTVTVGGLEITYRDSLGFSCVYGTGQSTDLGTLKGGEKATIEVNAVFQRVSGLGSCQAETRWTANLEVTAPTPLYVAAS